MSFPIQQRVLQTLTPQVASSPGLWVRIAADAFIPWQWVEFPDPPPAAAPASLVIPVALAGAALDFFVHGDGRMPVARSDEVGTRFRTRGVVEVDVIERAGESFGSLAQNQSSKSELRLANGRVLHTETGRNPVTSKFIANRLGPHSVAIEIVVSGAVPWNVAGPQPAIDLKYSVNLTYHPTTRKVRWNVAAEHDGFPGHELFIESAGIVQFNKSYLPTWFSPPSTGTAHPSIVQATQGATALGGMFNRQTWTQSGEFMA